MKTLLKKYIDDWRQVSTFMIHKDIYRVTTECHCVIHMQDFFMISIL